MERDAETELKVAFQKHLGPDVPKAVYQSDRPDERLNITVKQLATMLGAMANPSRRQLAGFPNAYRPCSRKIAQKELDSIANLATKFAKSIGKAHAPAIGALADKGLFPLVLVQCLELTEAIAKASRMAKVSDLPEAVPTTGRPILEPARIVARIVLETFVTYVPDANFEIPNGARRAAPLLRDVFRILGIQASYRAALKGALEARKAERTRPSVKRRHQPARTSP
jgi:hypothetical protein